MWRSPTIRLAVALAAGIHVAAYPGGRIWLVSSVFLVGCALVVARRVGTAPVISLRPLLLSILMAGAFGALGHLRGRAIPAGAPSVGSMPPSVRCIGTAGRPRGSRVPVSGARCQAGVPQLSADVFLPAGSPVPETGARVRFSGRVRRPGPPRNPGDRDARVDLRLRGLEVQVFADDFVSEPSPRSRFRNGIEARFRADRTGLMSALLIGKRDALSSATTTHFREAGLAHLLALSGLHVVFIGFGLHLLLGGLLARSGLGWWVATAVRVTTLLGLLGAFTWVTGMSPSVVRAVVMTACVLLRPLAGRASTDPWNALGAAALLLLWARPFDLYDLGFVLSFTAVASLLSLSDDWDRRGRRPSFWMRTLRSSLVATWSVTLGTLPVVLAAFGRVPLAALLLNVPAIPLAGAVMTGGMAGLILPGYLGEAAIAGAAICARALVELAEYGSRFPAISGGATSATVAGVLLVGSRLLRHRRARRSLLHGLALLALVPLPRPAVIDVVVLDVGQGDATLVVMPNGRSLLVDAGPPGSAWRIARALRFVGRTELDVVVLTHAHADHQGGLSELTALVPVGRVYGLARGRALRAGDEIVLDERVRIQVLAPDGGLRWSENDHSVVLRIAFGQTVILLTGDLEANGENTLVSRFGPLLAADVLKVPHHGSRTSSTARFIEAAADSATWTVVSVGARNRFGHPAPSVLARWRESGAVVVRTDVEGAAWFRSDGRRAWRRDWR